MKRPRNPAIALLLAVSIACASSATKTAYVTVGSAKAAVDLSMKTWAQYVANQGRCPMTFTGGAAPAGCVTQDQEAKVRKAYTDVQVAARTAAVALQTGSQTLTPESLSAAVSALVSLVEQFTGKKLIPTGGAH
jgi:hypothetical protein